MPEQIPLLPLRVEALFENPTDSKDLKHFARTSDGQDYACKRISEHPLLPCSEFLSYRIAEACQIAVPHSAVLALAGGEHAFGSRIEGGVANIGNLPEGISRPAAITECSEQISSILALDLFLANTDRHPGNFLFRRNMSGRLTAISIDYGRGVFTSNFPYGPLPLGDCHTSTTLQLLKQTETFRAPVAVFAISAVLDIRPAHITRWMSEMPRKWLPDDHGDALLAWWSSDKLPARIDAVLKCL
jgi:hypothetical protein